jgi:hypothetical protein
MAKRQELVLNTGKLSGICGRLMCCLGFEHAETYPDDTVLAEENAMSIAEDEEPVEMFVASSDLLEESEEPVVQTVVEHERPALQPELKEHKGKFKKFKRHRRRRKRKLPTGEK